MVTAYVEGREGSEGSRWGWWCPKPELDIRRDDPFLLSFFLLRNALREGFPLDFFVDSDESRSILFINGELCWFWI